MNAKPAPARFLLPVLLVAALLPFTGCMTAEQHRAATVGPDRLSVGTVQKDLRTGMSGADVIALLGPPNIVTTDDQRREVWTYDKVATEFAHSSSGLSVSPFILGTGSVLGAASGNLHQSAGAASRSERTLTVIVKFDENKRVRDFAYRASQF